MLSNEILQMQISCTPFFKSKILIFSGGSLDCSLLSINKAEFINLFAFDDVGAKLLPENILAMAKDKRYMARNSLSCVRQTY